MRTVTLSVKNVPRDLAARLRDRAARHHRSLQGELLAILTEAGQVMTVTELAAFVKRLGLQTPADSADIVRAARDGRHR
jgi:plasmid stability protein